MSFSRLTGLYTGTGQTLMERGETLPLFHEDPKLHDPAEYLPDPNLRDAVNVALSMGMPLLLTGEPGTGKTELAASISWELGLGEPEVFHTKSTSTFTDLFYRYDSLRHFRDVQTRHIDQIQIGGQSIDHYIEFGPLGRAILSAMDRTAPNCPFEYRNLMQRRTVVLIDELDKAPRDFPNDILNEVDRMTFQVNELPPERNVFAAEQTYRPILIMTSNLERDLPEAFRRRCVFYHIEFDELDLFEIVRRRLPRVEEFDEKMIANAITHFRHLREAQKMDKRPATAELLAWIDLLQRLRLDVKDVRSLGREERIALAASYSLLAKSDEDLKKLRSEVLS